MEPSHARKQLTGMARSVDALFAPAPSPASRVEDLVWEEVEGPVGPDPAAADPEALRAAVTRFLESSPLDRDGKARTVRLEAAALREANALDVLADSVERLTREAGDPPDEACIAMARALLTEGVAARVADRLGGARNDERRDELITTCRRLGEGMVEGLERMIEDGRWFVVRNAAAILGDIGGKRAVELVTVALAHPEARVRREGLLALAKIGGDDAGLLIQGMIGDTDPDVRLAAAMAAGELKVERALRPLLAVLDDESEPSVVVGVLHALGQLGDPRAVTAIEKRAVGSFFSRPPPDVRIAAYRALHKIGTPHARSLLVQAIDDRGAEVKAAVRELLGVR